MTVSRPDWLEGFIKRWGRYQGAKTRAVHLADWLRDECQGEGWNPRKEKTAVKLAECGSYLEFRRFFTRPELPVRLHAGQFCQQPRLCGLCAIRRSTKLLRAYVPKLNQLVHRDRRFVSMLTLTIKTRDDLGEMYQHLHGSLRRILLDGWRSRRGYVKRGHPWALFRGGVFSYEFKRSGGTRGGGGWHPHIHGLVITDGAVEEDQSWDIRTRWCEVAGDAGMQGQDLRPLRSMLELQPEVASEAAIADGLGDDLVEVFKYPLKFTGMEPADQWEASEAVRRKHLIRPFGCLRGMKVEESYLDEPLDVGDLPYLRLLLQWERSTWAYKCAEQIFVDK